MMEWEGGATIRQEGGGAYLSFTPKNQGMERVSAMLKRVLTRDTAGLGMLKRGGEGFHSSKGQEKMYFISRGRGQDKFQICSFPFCSMSANLYKSLRCCGKCFVM